VVIDVPDEKAPEAREDAKTDAKKTWILFAVHA
jgi:hypothetical protein